MKKKCLHKSHAFACSMTHTFTKNGEQLTKDFFTPLCKTAWKQNALYILQMLAYSESYLNSPFQKKI